MWTKPSKQDAFLAYPDSLGIQFSVVNEGMMDPPSPFPLPRLPLGLVDTLGMVVGILTRFLIIGEYLSLASRKERRGAVPLFEALTP